MKSLKERSEHVKNFRVIGLDISKDEIIGCIEKIGIKAFKNDHEGIKELIKISQEEPTIIGLEPTGPYHKKCEELMGKAGIEVVIINPLNTKRSKEMLDNSPSKNDAKDAMIIKELVERGYYLKPIKREGIYRKLQEGHVCLCRINKEMTRKRNELHAAERGAVMGEKERRWLVQDIIKLNKHCKIIEKELERYMEEVPYEDSLKSIPQLGKITIARILGETGDLMQYKGAESVISVSGLKLYNKESGHKKGQTHITKRGRPELRRLLFMATLRMIKKEGVMRERYLRIKGNGKSNIEALVACARALVRIMLAIAKKGETYKIGNQGGTGIIKGIHEAA